MELIEETVASGKLKEDKPDNNRGRPKGKRDFSKKRIESLFINEFSKICCKKFDKKQRIDAKNATISRWLKKIPLHFLMKLGSRWMYKSKCIIKVLKEYLLIFIEWFLRLYKRIPKKGKSIVFLHYIIWSFPQKKIAQIIESLRYADSTFIDEATYKNLVAQINMRTQTSLASFQDFAKNNKAFMIILNSTPFNLLKLSDEVSNRIKDLINSLTSQAK